MGQDFEIHYVNDEERRLFVKIDKEMYYAPSNGYGRIISPFEIIHEHRAMRLTFTDYGKELNVGKF